jgi:DNA helicase HerA-like ATPase
MEKVELAVRLIRSKGVGVYLVTQNPLDIPDPILGQLGNRIQHALRAFTPRQQKAVRAIAQTLRPNPGLDTERSIMELGVGEALVSMLDEEGIPAVVQRGKIRPPSSRIGPITPAERRISMVNSPIRGKYDQGIDRRSAYEMLMARAEEAVSEAGERGESPRTDKRGTPPRDSLQSLAEAMAKSLGRSLGRQLGRRIGRGTLGSIFKGK